MVEDGGMGGWEGQLLDATVQHICKQGPSRLARPVRACNRRSAKRVKAQTAGGGSGAQRSKPAGGQAGQCASSQGARQLSQAVDGLGGQHGWTPARTIGQPGNRGWDSKAAFRDLSVVEQGLPEDLVPVEGGGLDETVREESSKACNEASRSSVLDPQVLGPNRQEKGTPQDVTLGLVRTHLRTGGCTEQLNATLEGRGDVSTGAQGEGGVVSVLVTGGSRGPVGKADGGDMPQSSFLPEMGCEGLGCRSVQQW